MCSIPKYPTRRVGRATQTTQSKTRAASSQRCTKPALPLHQPGMKDGVATSNRSRHGQRAPRGVRNGARRELAETGIDVFQRRQLRGLAPAHQAIENARPPMRDSEVRQLRA